MTPLDWIVLACTLILIILYGVFKSRASKDLEGYFCRTGACPGILFC